MGFCLRRTLYPGNHRSDFDDAEAALAALQAALEAAARAEALAAGAEDIQITATRELRTAKTEAREMFIEGEITVEASGRPRIAR